MNITNGDCLKLMKDLPDKSVDLFICDLPYGETNCKWDCVIDLEEFWKEFKRLRKSKRTACIHFCSTKFGYTLIKSNEKMFKMDMVWKKRNKTGGLQSRHRPMRNHEMVYFFYEQAPKYNRDKYHKRIQAKNPASVVEAKPKKNKTIKAKDRKAMGESSGIYAKENQTASSFEPPNPASVVEEKDEVYGKACKGNFTGKNSYGAFEPPNPASVISEAEKEEKPKKKLRDKTNSTRAKEGKDIFGNNDTNVKPFNYDPPNPASVVEELIEPAEDEPVSMFESKKVFIGKRHHQTEKPLDILEFFIKYWTDEGQTILDPTMGSGSTGVACKTLKRNFIGFEMDENIFKVAEGRIKKAEVII